MQVFVHTILYTMQVMLYTILKKNKLYHTESNSVYYNFHHASYSVCNSIHSTSYSGNSTAKPNIVHWLQHRCELEACLVPSAHLLLI